MRKYITTQGDMWDLIAFKCYQGWGGEKLTTALIEANSQFADIVIFPAGCNIDIPDVYIPAAKTLPPWMR